MSDDKVFQQNNHHSSDLNSRNTPGHEDPNSHCDATPKTNGSSSLLIVPQDEVLFKRRQCTVKIEQDDDCLEEEGGNSSEGSVRSESETSRLSHENRGGSSPKKTLRYRYKVWSDAYMKMRTSPFLDSPISGQLPQFVRYPPRNPQNVEVVIRSDKAFAKLSGRVEVPITLPVKKPNARNWKEVLVGDLVWCKWRSKEYWPATVYEIGDTTPLMVTVLWTNDTTQSTVDYSHVDTFDLAFHLRFDSRRSDQKYLKAVATALRYAGKMGFWEKFLTKKLYDEIVKQTSPAFCRHIGEKEIAELFEEASKGYRNRRRSLERRTKHVELILSLFFLAVTSLLFALRPLWDSVSPKLKLIGMPRKRRRAAAGTASVALHQCVRRLPFGGQCVASHSRELWMIILGVLIYASRNSEPLFEEGKIPLFEPKPQYEIDPHILGSNEIYHPDEMGSYVMDCERGKLSAMVFLDRSKKRRKKKVLSAVLDEKPPTPEPFSEIDALRRLPYRITSKKRPVANLEIKQAKVRRFN
ncbi:hypothetical protein KIN20_006648 [Parelaphostrongylus tenuis]|uniref:PWWP domain-containing protein n=1 Tax=Parelaphostrongylus tenuis TaxID=148309 RepID=A0AAD5QJG3_PARTN|nr:hypothetical protein KIN20_006648 [Parelaphostrongylus tenuis]